MQILNIDINRPNIVANNNLAMKGVQTQKLIKRVEEAPILKKVQVTFEELERMYNEIGYDVIRKRGSHAIVPVTEKANIAIVIPHKDKRVDVKDLRRFLLVKAGKIEEALKL